MGNCRSCAQRAEQKRYQVVLTASNRVVYRTNDRAAAERIARNYPGAEIRDKQNAASTA